MHFNYDVLALVGVAVCRQDPVQWPPFFQSPWLATSLRDFWSHRWHQLYRRLFVVFGGWPLSFVCGRPGYISSHREYSSMLSCMLLSFGMTAVGIVLEDVFTALMSRTVGG